MKIIDLINMRADGEEMPKKIRIDHWCYKFEWIEHENNYYDRNAEIDLMSCLSMDKEELNYEVEIIEEDKEIESIDVEYYKTNDERYNELLEEIASFQEWCIDKVNSLEKEQ